MNDELIEINKNILLKGLFALKFSEDEEKVIQELDILEKSKRFIYDKLEGMKKESNKKIEEYKNHLIETKSKYDLNLVKNPQQTISEKIEDYKEYKTIYNQHYEYIKSIKELYISKKKYDGLEYDYLITKI